jgi:hypothetical protein
MSRKCTHVWPLLGPWVQWRIWEILNATWKSDCRVPAWRLGLLACTCRPCREKQIPHHYEFWFCYYHFTILPSKVAYRWRSRSIFEVYSVRISVRLPVITTEILCNLHSVFRGECLQTGQVCLIFYTSLPTRIASPSHSTPCNIFS